MAVNIDLTFPDGGQYFVNDLSSVNIVWSDGTGPASIYLFKGGIQQGGAIATGVVSGYVWNVTGYTVGADYQIKVVDDGDASEDISAANFSISDAISLSAPNGGQYLVNDGPNYNITWTGGTGSATIYLFKGGFQQGGAIATGVASGYAWNVTGYTPGDDYQIKVVDDGDLTEDISATNFSISNAVSLTAPNGGQYLVNGTTFNITWTGGAINATLELYKNNILVGPAISTTATTGIVWNISGYTPGADYKVKVIDNNNGTFDESDANFSISDPIVVVSPNGGESWANLSSHNITWTGGTGDVKIELYKGLVNLGTLADNQAGFSYNWPINQDMGNDYTVKISDNNSLSNDVSNNNFTITQYVHVTVPNVPDVRWTLGSTHNITWTDNVPGPVKIELYYNGTLHGVLASVADGTNTFAWTIPVNHLMGNLFKVRISSIDDPSIVDMSDFNFRIDAATNTYAITMIQPSDAGIVWVKGSSYLISWVDNLNSPVRIDLITPTSLVNIAPSVEGSTYGWTIDAGIPAATNYKIMVTSTTDNSVLGESEFDFEITATPPQANIIIEQPTLPGLYWLRGSSYLISWTDNVPNNVVDIVLCNSGGTELATLKSGAEGSTWVWTIPALTYAPGDYRIKVKYGGISGSSIATFHIGDSPAGAYITLLQPNVDGITWLENHDYLISWEDNIPGTVDIYYYRTSDLTEVPIATDVAGSTYVWSIPAMTDGDDYFVKIYSHADPTIAGDSDFAFAIQGFLPGGEVIVNSPNGGETWVKGNEYLISWDDNFAENVKIELVNYSTVTTTLIANNVEGSTYVWTIPNNGSYPAGIQYTVRVTSVETNTVTDESNAYFTIVDPASVAVYPNPADREFTVKFNAQSNEEYTVVLVDRFNMPVMTRTINTENTKELQVQTSFLPVGVYFMTLTSGNTKHTEKILIQH
ncbi:MAG: T9SS type A sorting domain-containing protein [Bacteroidetes bacterium]|nr:T9SS type A sorting domain-containing protein [Bacteroidota bacterium]